MLKVLIVSYLADKRPIQLASYIDKTIESKIDFVTTSSVSLPSFFNQVYYLKKSNFRNVIDKIYIYLKSKLYRESNANYSIHQGINEYSPLKTKVKNIRSLLDYFVDFILEPKLNSFIYLNRYDYDLVISSYSPWTSHTVAYALLNKIKKSNKNVKWIADFRDPVVQSSTPLYLKSLLNQKVKRITRRADLALYVAPCDKSKLNIYHTTPTYILENGFSIHEVDKLEKHELKDFELDNNKFKLLYAGSLYDGRSDLSPVITAFNKLIYEGLINSNEISFYYFGMSKNYFDMKYAKYCDFETLSFHSIPKNKIHDLYTRVDLVISSAWLYKDSCEGDPSSKVYELLALDKPHISIVKKESSNLNSHAKKVLNNYRNSYVFEIASQQDFDTSVLKIMDIILNLVNNKPDLKSNGIAIDNYYSTMEVSKRFVNFLKEIKFI